MVARDEYSPSDFSAMQSVSMHELGHALSVGWADDAPIPYIGGVVGDKAFEVYSGNTDSSLAGGVDSTPERINILGGTTEWTLMRRGEAEDMRDYTSISAPHPINPFSIEELSTVDFSDIPSADR